MAWYNLFTPRSHTRNRTYTPDTCSYGMNWSSCCRRWTLRHRKRKYVCQKTFWSHKTIPPRLETLIYHGWSEIWFYGRSQGRSQKNAFVFIKTLMLRTWLYKTVTGIDTEITELTTVNHLKKRGMWQYASMVQQAVMSMLIGENPDIDDISLDTSSRCRVIAIGRISHIWKEPVWDWKTGKLISANTGGNWQLHDNFNIPPDSKPIRT